MSCFQIDYKVQRIYLNEPCTIFLKNKKHLRDVLITEETTDSLTYSKSKKTGTVCKIDIVDISFQNE